MSDQPTPTSLIRKRGLRNKGWRLVLVMAVSLLPTLPTLGHAAASGQAASLRVARQGAVVLPKPLSADDADTYRRLFALQDQHRYVIVDRLTRLLGDRLLLGRLLAQRYLDDPSYRSSYRELATWLSHYGDQPGAERIYALAKKRRPVGASLPRPARLSASADLAVEDGPSYVSPLRRSKATARQVAGWRQQIPALIREGKIAAADQMLLDGKVGPLVDDAEYDIARFQVGKAWLAAGEPDRAYARLGPAAYRSAAVLPQMAWSAGLAAWRVNDYAGAQHFFAEFINRSTNIPANVAMGSFWAARASLAAKRPQFVGRFMRLAAATSDPFYGRLAQAVLGEPLGFSSSALASSDRTLSSLMTYAAGKRALALSQIGRPELADQEVMALAKRNDDPALSEALWKLTEALELPPETAAAMSFASVGLPKIDYPVLKVKARRFTVDRALVLAVIRSESGFDQHAISAAGAKGLMQIMPETAAAVALRTGSDFDEADLHDPVVNLKLGQGYLKLLMAQKQIGPNLIYLAAAYNAGPGRVIQWAARDEGIDDPLYFLESIPLAETRAYVKNVLSAYWVYQEQFAQETTSLDELRSGDWPTYRKPAKKLQTASSE